MDFTGSPVVKTPLPGQGVWVWSLGGGQKTKILKENRSDIVTNSIIFKWSESIIIIQANVYNKTETSYRYRKKKSSGYQREEGREGASWGHGMKRYKPLCTTEINKIYCIVQGILANILTLSRV